MDKEYRARRCIRLVIGGMIFSGVIFFIRRDRTLTGLSDACAIIGICLLILALFRTARYLKFYDLIIYGTNKLKKIILGKAYRDADTGTYSDFTCGRKYADNFIEAYIACGVMFALSAGVLLI